MVIDSELWKETFFPLINALGHNALYFSVPGWGQLASAFLRLFHLCVWVVDNNPVCDFGTRLSWSFRTTWGFFQPYQCPRVSMEWVLFLIAYCCVSALGLIGRLSKSLIHLKTWHLFLLSSLTYLATKAGLPFHFSFVMEPFSVAHGPYLIFLLFLFVLLGNDLLFYS